jgi:hypothetical protein
MSEFPPEEGQPDFELSYAEIVNGCIEKLALIARDIEINGQVTKMDPSKPETVVDFASQLRERIKQLAKDEEELAIQESIIESVENIIFQLIALSGLIKQLEARD